MSVIIKESEVNPVGVARSLGFDYSMTDGERYISPKKNTMSKYRTDKERMDIIAERLVHRQDIWQDRYIYWIAVAIGHILEWIVKHGTNGVDADNSITDADKGE